ncbi:MFS domain-containing protein [Trichostrongylus colubriformis]|uniref:MFS domain-containing protein n=1 Tax=Trichostrongylus colubriformis TaxID=6319 RepID=A0AAN8G622_TRICO
MNNQGVVTTKIITDGTCNAQKFCTFLEELVAQMNGRDDMDGAWLIMDNARIHKTTELRDILDGIVPVEVSISLLLHAQPGGFASVALHLGDVLASLLMYWMCLPTVLGSNSNWPIVPGIAFVLCLLMYVFTVSIPDSPKWLVRNGEKVRAAEALRFYHGTEEDPDKVMTSLCLETQLTSTKSLTIKEAWHDEAIKEAMKVIMVLQLMFISASPIPLERMYSVVIHTSVGLTVEQSLMLSWLSTLVVTPLTFLSTIAIDRFGRRPVVFVAATIIFCKILIMFSARLLVFFISPSWITMLMATVNEFASDLISCTGAGAVASLLIAELVPPAARVAVAQVLLFVPLVSTLPTMTAFPVVNALFAPAIYIPMLICQPFLVGYLIKNLPETKIRPVYEIVHNFEEEVRSRANTRHSISERTPLLKSRSGSIRSANGVPIVV